MKALSGRERAKQWRESRGLSQQQVALAIGFKGHATYARWEEGKGSLSNIRLYRLCGLMHCRLDELATGRQAEEIALLKGE